MPIVSAVPGRYAFATDATGVMGEMNVAANASDDMVGFMNAVSLTKSDTPMVTERLADARWLLGTGAHQGVQVTRAGVGAVQGISLETAVDGPIVCMPGTTTFISGVEMIREGQGHLLIVRPAARVIVSNCVFAQRDDSDASPIQIDAGAKAIINNCVFTGMATTANVVVSHGGAAAHAFASYCVNLTGQAASPNTFANAVNVTQLGGVS